MKKVYSKIKEKYYRFDREINPDGNSSFRRKVKYAYSEEGTKKLFRFTGKLYKKYLGKVSTHNKANNQIDAKTYQKWRLQNTPNKIGYKRLAEILKHFDYQPKISVLLKIENPNFDYLISSIVSVIEQTYSNWELIIYGNSMSDVIEFCETHHNIKILFDLKIEQSDEFAISKATGEFISFLKNEDLLAKEALYEIIAILQEKQDINFIYSDEDKIDSKEYHLDPLFKPDWSPDTFLSRNYINNTITLRKSLIDSIHINESYQGSKYYDLILRVTEHAEVIHHIPKVLYHSRITNKKIKDITLTTNLEVINNALRRRKEKALAMPIKDSETHYTIRYELKKLAKVSIVIPTKDQTLILKNCIDSIFRKSKYTNFEIILVDNGSSDPSFFELIEYYKSEEPDRFQCFTNDIPFNFSKLINFGVTKSSGEYILLLNNDTEVITSDWIESMLEQAQRDSIGVVGAQLLFPNDTIQHAGVILGMEGISGHCFIGYDLDAPGYSNMIKTTNNFSALTGACMMIHKEKYLEVGGFDERFAVEFNDIDFCLKLKEKGYHNIYLPHTKLYHYESLSRGNQISSTRMVKEINLMKKRWEVYIEQDPCYNANLSLEYTDFRL